MIQMMKEHQNKVVNIEADQILLTDLVKIKTKINKELGNQLEKKLDPDLYKEMIAIKLKMIEKKDRE